MGAAPQDWETPVGDEKNRESKDRMGRLPFYPGYRCQAESRIEGRLPFYLVKKAALKGRLPIPILSCQKDGPCGAATILSWLQPPGGIQNWGAAPILSCQKGGPLGAAPILSCQKGGPWGAAPILSWLQAESRICGFCLFARIEWRLPLTLRFWTHSILAKGGIQNILGKNPWKAMEKTVKRRWKRIKKTVKNG